MQVCHSNVCLTAKNVFKLNDNFTKNDLRSAYIKKVNNIKSLNIDDEEKHYYLYQLTKLYKKTSLSLQNNYTYKTGYFRSFNSITKNGITVVNENESILQPNGKIESKNNSYKIDRNKNIIS